MTEGETGAFVKVEGKVADEIPATPLVGLAYGFIWIVVLAYVAYVGRGLGKVKSDLAELRRKLAGGAGKPPAQG